MKKTLFEIEKESQGDFQMDFEDQDVVVYDCGRKSKISYEDIYYHKLFEKYETYTESLTNLLGDK